MSYCRQSDYIPSDVYVYETSAGIAIQVAKVRPEVEGPLPELPKMSVPPSALDLELWGQVLKEVGAIRMDSPHIEIGLPFDGKHFLLSSYTEAAHKLIELFDLGYNVPLYAIEGLFSDALEIQEAQWTRITERSI